MTSDDEPTLSELANTAFEWANTRRGHRAARIRTPHSREDAEAHRLRGIARLKAASGGAPPKVLRIPLTNVLSGNDYSAELAIGSKGAVANVILDTGSSTLAVEPSVYSGAGDGDLSPTTWLQLVTYGTGGWAGPVVNTTLNFGGIALPGAPVAITSVQQKGNFQGVTGIMGLAYNGLNDAFDFRGYLGANGKTGSYPWPFAGQSWSAFSTAWEQLRQSADAQQIDVKPYFDQLEMHGVVANKFAFYTLRSWVSLRQGNSAAAASGDPLNRGYFVLGGGEEQKDLYTGAFANVKVMHDLYYNTNLKSVRVDGGAAHVAARLQPQFMQGGISNSIIDSGTSDLSLAKDVYAAILTGLGQKNPAFIKTIEAAAKSRVGIPAGALNLAQWPDIYFTLEGETGDVELKVTPQTYWQTDFPTAGRAVFQISGPLDDANQSVLGLPLLNNYYAVFDRAQNVNGVIRFAAIKPPG
jgi:hypothetical protein